MVKRIVVLGSTGAGKTWISKRLGKAFDLPVIDLDELYWSCWQGQNPSQDEIANKLKEVADEPSWVIAGNHGNLCNGRSYRIAACDAVLYLDLLPLLCMFRIVKRRLCYLAERSKDLPPYMRFTWQHIQVARTFRSRPLREEIMGLRDTKPVVVLKSRRKVKRFLALCKTEGTDAIRRFAENKAEANKSWEVIR